MTCNDKRICDAVSNSHKNTLLPRMMKACFHNKITPESVSNELHDFNHQLAAGAVNILNMTAPSCGVTAHNIVFQRDKLRLLHYKSVTQSPPGTVPLLIVYSLINRPYLADLQADRSMIRGLLDQGQDVYLIDWGYPAPVDRFLTLDDYLNGALHACVNEVCKRHNIEQLNLLGICQGGVLSLCYSAMYPDKVRNLVTMVTPVDFHTPDNMLSHWAKHIDVDLLVDTFGNVPGQMLNALFISLKPHRQIGQKYLNLIDVMDDPPALENFMQMEKWISDCPDQAGEAFREFLKDFVQQNKLVNGGIMIGNRAIDLKEIDMPVFNIYAEYDHLVPPASAKALGELLSSDDYSELAFNSGHIGPFVSSKAQTIIPTAIAKWLNER